MADAFLFEVKRQIEKTIYIPAKHEAKTEAVAVVCSGLDNHRRFVNTGDTCSCEIAFLHSRGCSIGLCFFEYPA